MTKCSYWIFIVGFLSLCSACDDEPNEHTVLTITHAYAGAYNLKLTGEENNNVPQHDFILATFSAPLDVETVNNAVQLKTEGSQVEINISFLDNNQTIKIDPVDDLQGNKNYELILTSSIKGEKAESFGGLVIPFSTAALPLLVTKISSGTMQWPNNQSARDVSADDLEIMITFDKAIDPASVSAANVSVKRGGNIVPSTVELVNPSEIRFTALESLRDFTRYDLMLSNIIGTDGEILQQVSRRFYTGESTVKDFATISDDHLLTKVQQQTFKYFYDFAHPASGMARERNTSGDIVTTGGSGFGIMALIVGMERNFITRQQGIERMDRILDFLETADRFHGAWSHWVNGNTGNVVPFSANDNGGDLVETSFLIEGLITFRQYLDAGVPAEESLINRINALWQSVEWDWYTREGQKVLYWHWSPDKGWIMNHPIKGFNECLITYVLAAASPTHSISKDVYTQGWASNGGIVNGDSFYNITLPLGFDYGGPLFFTHYSFLGLDPRNLSDVYANYWTQNKNHTLINRAHSISNPLEWVGYSASNWGLTASDNHIGYSAHSPTNDLGVISPTAALSSFPYTPEESMEALHFFYYTLGDRLWGNYGFYDAFNLTEDWVANSYLAIDQGPIVVMIENYRTGLLWDLFMSAPEVQSGLTKLGFNY